jgi:PAS domain S-box-containing protein
MTGGGEGGTGLPQTIQLLFAGGDETVAQRVEAWLASADDIDVLSETEAPAVRLERERVDCALVDGRRSAVAERIREQDPSVPVILFAPAGAETSAGMSDDADEIVRGQFVDDDGEPLRTRVRNAVAGRHAAVGEGIRSPETERLSALFENAPVAIAYVEHDDAPRIRETNAVFEETFGISEVEAAGRDIDEVVTTAERRPDASRISSKVHEGDLFETVVTRETADGPREFLLRLIPVDENTEEVDRLFAVYTDITERKQRERELERLNDRVSGLHDVAHRLQSAESESEVYEETVRAAIDILEFDWCATSEPRDGRFELTAASESSPFQAGEAPLGVDEGVAGRVFRTGETDLTDDVVDDPDGAPADGVIRSSLTVPVGDDALFQAVASEVAGFDEDDRELAELLATHTSEALSRLERTAALERQNERISRIHEVAHRLQSAESETEVYEETVRAAIDILEFDWCATTRALDDVFEITAKSESGAFEEGDVSLGIDEGVGGRAFQSGETIVVDDVHEQERVETPDEEIRSALTAPIGEFGFFQALSSEVAGFDEDDRELAELLVTHTREALSRLAHASELERVNDRISRLHQVANRLQNAESETEVYEETVAAATDILEFDWCVTSRPVDGRFELTAASEATPFKVGDRPLAVDEGTSGWAFETGETDLTNDILAEEEGEPADDAIRSGLTVPIGEYGIFQGVSSEVGAFDEHDRELAELLVAHTQSALQWLERTDELERQNERLEQFASVVSHDLRNPLNVAQGRVTIARDTGELSHLDDAEEALTRMNSIIDDVLALAREEPSVSPRPVDIEPVARTAWSMVDTGDASLVVDAEGKRMADETRLQRLLENLFRNSIEHGDADIISVEPLDDGFAVVDDGIGFADADTALKSGESPGGSTGLGLAIVRRIAEAHDWTVTAANSDTGARVEVRGVEEA